MRERIVNGTTQAIDKKRGAVADSPCYYFKLLTNEIIVSSYFCGALTLTRE